MARRKADLSSADFWKGFGFAGEGCIKGAADCNCDCDCGMFCMGEKISCKMGLCLLNLSHCCSKQAASSLSLQSSRCCLGD